MDDLVTVLHLRQLAVSTASALGLMVVTFIPIAYFEHRQGADTSRYLSRRFVHDVLYSLYYRSGAFALLGAALTAEWLMSRLHFVQFNVLAGLPLPLAAVLFWFLTDLYGYWVHRVQHAVSFFWQFHAVHHAAEELNFLTTFRQHPVEQLFFNAVSLVPLLVLGVPTHLWFPFALLQSFFEAVQHAELDWGYGPLYRVFVSPVFHRIHHSTDRAHHDRNFAKVLSVWDYLFGTAAAERVPPRTYGVEGLPSEPTLAGQFLGPFRRILGRNATADSALVFNQSEARSGLPAKPRSADATP